MTGGALRLRATSEERFAHARSELVRAALPGTVAGAVVLIAVPWQAATLVGWDVAAAVFLVRVWRNLWRLDASGVARVATSEDPSRGLADLLVVGASLTCIVGVGFTLIHAARSTGYEVAALLALAAASLVASWLVVHTVFTLRYARLYYTGADGGISFNQSARPVYSDFAYLAFTIGMTFQVSDTNIEDTLIRRTALRHALISYLFGAVLVGMTVNVGASLLK